MKNTLSPVDAERAAWKTYQEMMIAAEQHYNETIASALKTHQEAVTWASTIYRQALRA